MHGQSGSTKIIYFTHISNLQCNFILDFRHNGKKKEVRKGRKVP